MYFYKAFVFSAKDSEMYVNTAGDTFSKTAEKAVYSVFDRMSENLLRMPGAEFFIGDKSLFRQTEPENMFMDAILIIRIELDDAEKVPSSFIEELDNENDASFALKDVTNGYKSSIQEYSISNLKVTYKDKGMVEKTFVVDLKISDKHATNFPDTIHLE